MRIWSRVLAFLVVALAAFWFTVANADERVTVDLVLFRLSTSLPLLVFGSMLIGMLAVIFVGLRADLQTRRALQRLRESGGGRSPSLRSTSPPDTEPAATGRLDPIPASGLPGAPSDTRSTTEQPGAD